jgi:hypothetical protein
MMIFTRSRLLPVLLALLGLLAVGCASDPIVVNGPEVSIEGLSEPAAEPEAETGTDSTPPGDAVDATDGDAEEPVILPEDFGLDFSGVGDEDATDQADAGPADGQDGPPVDLAFVRSAATTTESAESYRFEVRFGWQMSDPTFSLNLAPDTPLMVGATSGSATSMTLDFGPIFNAVFDALGGDEAVTELFGSDLTMQMVDDGAGSMYLRVPMFAALAAEDALPAEFARLADGWGLIDLTAVDGLSASEVARLTGTQSGSSPAELLDLLREAGSVEDLGAADVRGTPTTHLRVTVSFAEMIEAQGLDAAELEQMVGDVSAALVFEMPFDVFVDDQGRVRRVGLTFDLESIEALGGADLPPGAAFSMETTVDFFDFGADITVEVPTDEVVVDLTQAFAGLVG